MNNETNIVQSKPKTSGKKRAKKAVAFLLVVAILITSAYAFLTAHQTKTNVFTVGNIRLELHEDGWEANSALVNKTTEGDTYSDGSTYYTSSKLENIIPGEPITKDPMIKNVGKNDARVYMSVSMPQINGADAFTMNGMGANWNLFQTVEKDGYNVYYYHYANVLPANSGNDSNTTNLFQSVTLKDDAYSHMSTEVDYSIIINAYGCQTVGEDDWQEAWNKIRTGLQDSDLPEIEIIKLSYYRDNGDLYFEEEKAAGDPVEMKFDSSLIKQNFAFDWVTDEGETAYEGMTMPQHSLRLNATYNQLTTEPVSEGIFRFALYKDDNNEYCASLTNLINFDNRTVVNVPAEITFTYTGSASFDERTTGNDSVYVDTTYASDFNINQQYTIPVTSTSGFWYRYNSIKTVVLPDSIYNIQCPYSSTPDTHTENINVPYSITRLGDNFFNNMKNINHLIIPNKVTSLGYNVFGDSYINTLEIDKSFGNGGFSGGGISCYGNTIIINFDVYGDGFILPSFEHYIFNGNVYSMCVTTWRYLPDLYAEAEFTGEFSVDIPDKLTFEFNGDLICPENSNPNPGFSVYQGDQTYYINNVDIIVNGYVSKLGTRYPEPRINYTLLGSGTVDCLIATQWRSNLADQGYDMTLYEFDTSSFTGTINNRETQYCGV